MIPLYSEFEFQSAKSTDKLPCKCIHCHTVFYRKKKYITYALKHNNQTLNSYCTIYCHKNACKQIIVLQCANCGKEINKSPFAIKSSKSGNCFCSSSCSATYQNTHKTKGYRRSKLEIYLENQLTIIYPTLKIFYNQKDVINSELDIYIPSLKLAFELNGIFHYEPIYGQEKLSQIQNNDQRKYQACLEKNIEMCIIDTSRLTYFKEKNAKIFLTLITNIINNKLC